ncbi:MAG: hypothetical protein QOD97_2371, partial [Mycobacterium sp.]|nr:hypothetical protein [Mycobacterium sp.]
MRTNAWQTAVIVLQEARPPSVAPNGTKEPTCPAKRQHRNHAGRRPSSCGSLLPLIVSGLGAAAAVVALTASTEFTATL